MRLLNSLFLLITAGFLFSCEKETSYENPITVESIGSLKLGTSGDCLPSHINGIFRAGTALGATNYIDVEVEVASVGNYTISTDTINGYYFRGSGFFSSTGTKTVRLQGSGTPVTAITNRLTVSYSGTTCFIDVLVIDANTPAAVFTYETGAGGTCSGAIVNGTFASGQPLGAGSSVTLTVNVTTAGTYQISTTSVNGITFSGIGVFSTTGLQTITLNAGGVPSTSGPANISVTSGSSSCTFTVTVTGTSTGGAAVYTLGGASSNCTGVVLAGNYYASTAMNASNTVTVDVNVTTAGTYSLNTNSVNGVTFSSSGTFTSTGTQQVVLTATGTPAAQGAQNYTLTAPSGTCNFSITYQAALPPAICTLSTLAGGLCDAVVVNGSYVATIPMTTNNTVVVKVNVTAAGTYSISTNTVNGISFSASGIFTTTGTGIDVTLNATGTPTAAGTHTFTTTLQGATGTCTFDITTTAAPTGVYTCKIDGVFKSFYYDAEASVTDMFGQAELYLNGYADAPNGNTVPQFQIFITPNNNTPVGPGTYHNDGLALPNGYRLEIDYTVQNPDMSVTIWNTSSNIIPPPHPPFTVIVTSVTSTRVRGTFSGQLTNTLQGSTQFKTVTEGVFDLPIQ